MKTNTNLKTKSSLTGRLTTSLAAAVLGQAVLAQSWQTVLDYQLTQGQFAEGTALAADSLGNVFSAGYALAASGILSQQARGLVLKTDTETLNWYLSDDNNPSP